MGYLYFRNSFKKKIEKHKKRHLHDRVDHTY